MRERYVIINDDERTCFEKEWQLPYGYANSSIYFDFDEAISDFQEDFSNSYKEGWVIEKIDDYGREIVYKTEN